MIKQYIKSLFSGVTTQDSALALPEYCVDQVNFNCDILNGIYRRNGIEYAGLIDLRAFENDIQNDVQVDVIKVWLDNGTPMLAIGGHSDTQLIYCIAKMDGQITSFTFTPKGVSSKISSILFEDNSLWFIPDVFKLNSHIEVLEPPITESVQILADLRDASFDPVEGNTYAVLGDQGSVLTTSYYKFETVGDRRTYVESVGDYYIESDNPQVLMVYGENGFLPYEMNSQRVGNFINCPPPSFWQVDEKQQQFDPNPYFEWNITEHTVDIDGDHLYTLHVLSKIDGLYGLVFYILDENNNKQYTRLFFGDTPRVYLNNGEESNYKIKHTSSITKLLPVFACVEDGFAYDRAEASTPVIELDSNGVQIVHDNKYELFNNTVNGALFHKGRLVFWSKDNLSFSRTKVHGDYFYNNSIILADDDPIDISLTSGEDIKYCLSLQDALLSFCPRSQYATTSGGQPLTTKTVSNSVTTRRRLADVQPIGVGQNAYFVGNGGSNDTSSLLEYYTSGINYTSDAQDISLHCRGYIKGIKQMAASLPHNSIYMLSDDGLTIYVHKFLWSGDTKIQNAFFKYSIPVPLCAIDIHDGNMYGVYKGEDMHHLIVLDISDDRTDTYADMLVHNVHIFWDNNLSLWRLPIESLPQKIWHDNGYIDSYEDILIINGSEVYLYTSHDENGVYFSSSEGCLAETRRVSVGYNYESIYKFMIPKHPWNVRLNMPIQTSNMRIRTVTIDTQNNTSYVLDSDKGTIAVNIPNLDDSTWDKHDSNVKQNKHLCIDRNSGIITSIRQMPCSITKIEMEGTVTSYSR